MSKPRIFCLHAPTTEPTFARLSAMLDEHLGLKCERFDLRQAKKLPAPGAAWYIFLLSPDLKAQAQELNWVAEHHPERIICVMARPTNPGDIHPRLEFQETYDFLPDGDDEAARLLRDWQPGEPVRARPASSVIMFLSLKGGVAKTTNLVAVAECLAEAGNRVLVIDTDHQCGASAVLLGEEALDDLERRERTLTDLFWEALNDDFRFDRIASYAAPATSIAGVGRCLSVIPGSLRLEDFWSHFRRTPRRESATVADAQRFLRDTRSAQFQRWLKKNYDYVLVDCPPAVAWQVRFFLRVADGYVVPTIPDRLSVRGARYLSRRIQNIGVRITPVGLLWSMYRVESTIHKQYVTGIRTGAERLPWEDPNAPSLPQPFGAQIPNGNDVIQNSLDPETQPRSVSAKYGSKFAGIYRALTGELLCRLRRAGTQPAAGRPDAEMAGSH